MSLTPGSTVGPYQVTARIGAGGMGEVFRATDIRLRREIALKVLPASLATDTARMERMRREAQALAALNHPNIAAIHGIEGHALVMELVEGVPLRGPLPLDTALQYARQIAEALEHAHEKGIIHRDLKPANVKISADGVVKVLDFGLAKMADDQSSPADPANSPTLSLRGTEAGLILGTAAYMAPEQARGASVDRRADIWAFGAVLYEMLTGRRLFEGETVTDTLAAVLRSDITLDALPRETPAAIRALVGRCLERDRKKRLQAIGEARIVIDEVLSGGPAAAAPAAATRSGRPRIWIAATAALAVLLLAVAVIAVRHLQEPAPVSGPVASFDLTMPEVFGTSPPPWLGPVVSPDGRQVALAGPGGLFVRSLGSTRTAALDAVASGGRSSFAALPFWSADSRTIGYFSGSNRRILRVALTGGAPQVLADLSFAAANAVWAPDGSIVVAEVDGPLHRIGTGGGDPVALTSLDRSRGETGHLVSTVLPNGKLLYMALTGGCAADVCTDTATVYVRSLDSNDATRLVENVAWATYAETPGGGALVYIRANELWAQRFDAESRTLSGEPVRVATEIEGGAPVSASLNGVLTYRALAPAPPCELVWLDRTGSRLGTVADPAIYTNPALSRDERWLAVAVGDPNTVQRDIWVVDLVRRTRSRLTASALDETNPTWSPDGQSVAYSSAVENSTARQILRKPASGVGDAAVVLEDKEFNSVESWSPDGRYLLYTRDSADIWRLPVSEGATPDALVETEFSEAQATVSPDGRWLAYRSDQSKRQEVYVQTFPPGPQRWQISNAGGSDPQWRADGRELFYVSDDQLMAVSITPRGQELDAGEPRPLFRVSVEQANRRSRFVVADNGQRFLVVQPTAVTTPARMVAIVNWALE